MLIDTERSLLLAQELRDTIISRLGKDQGSLRGLDIARRYVREIFNRLDVDGSGHIDQYELRELLSDLNLHYRLAI